MDGADSAQPRGRRWCERGPGARGDRASRAVSKGLRFLLSAGADGRGVKSRSGVMGFMTL